MNTGLLSLSAEQESGTVMDLPGPESDNLLGFLSVLGLLRALEASPLSRTWRPRLAWRGPPWTAQLHLATVVSADEVIQAAADGLLELSRQVDTDGRKNTSDFSPEDFRRYLERLRDSPVGTSLATSLAMEASRAGEESVVPGPLVLLFGQGHQHFLERLSAAIAGTTPARFVKKAGKRAPPDMRDPRYLHEALLQPWRRKDDADALRWDPAEDQRYALRHGNPSDEGAALTVHGANRLAAAGFLSFVNVPRQDRHTSRGALRGRRDAVSFMWPIWTQPIGRTVIEALLSHPATRAGRVDQLAPYGVTALRRARRVANGKFRNVTRAVAYDRQPLGDEEVE